LGEHPPPVQVLAAGKACPITPGKIKLPPSVAAGQISFAGHKGPGRIAHRPYSAGVRHTQPNAGNFPPVPHQSGKRTKPATQKAARPRAG